MISNTFIFIFGTLIFGFWLVGSFLEFRKMAKNPENYQTGGNLDSTPKKD
jgi:hypothetical protein